MSQNNGSNITGLCSKLAWAGHDLKLSIDKEEETHKAFLNALDMRRKTETEYHKIKKEIDNMTGI